MALCECGTRVMQPSQTGGEGGGPGRLALTAADITTQTFLLQAWLSRSGHGPTSFVTKARVPSVHGARTTCSLSYIITTHRQPVRFHTFTAGSECVANVEPLKPRRTIKAMSGGSKINGKLRVLCGNPAEMRGFPCDGQVRCQLWLNSPKSGREQGGWRNVIIFYPSSIHPSLSRVPPSLPLPLPPSLTPSSSSSHPPPTPLPSSD